MRSPTHPLIKLKALVHLLPQHLLPQLSQETIFEWIITGNADTPHPRTKILSFFNVITLERLLSAFWELEDVPRKMHDWGREVL